MSRLAVVGDWVIGACRQLDLPVESIDDDLFEAGATSLTVIRLISRVEKEFGADALTPEEVIERSALRAIAAAIVTNTSDSALTAAED
jgi:acyl carrier protein